jgi:hypothetical protein
VVPAARHKPDRLAASLERPGIVLHAGDRGDITRNRAANEQAVEKAADYRCVYGDLFAFAVCRSWMMMKSASGPTPAKAAVLGASSTLSSPFRPDLANLERLPVVHHDDRALLNSSREAAA